MEYTVNMLAKMAGVSTRTLRYYDECGLLPARRNSSNGYRIYGQEDVDRLQQIMFYRELGVTLDEIARILTEPNFEPLVALDSHLTALQAKREQLDTLIRNVENSIRAMKGEMTMQDSEKFEGFKQKLIDENEQQYGEEIRAKYGDETIDRSNANLKGMSKEKYAESERLRQELENTLKIACEQGDPANELAQKACGLHKDWLIFWWGDNVAYSQEAHLAMGQMYVDDPRFTAYYDKIAPGLAAFLLDALKIYCRV
jgi:DNA-binding transcriptional MerR regulator